MIDDEPRGFAWKSAYSPVQLNYVGLSNIKRVQATGNYQYEFNPNTQDPFYAIFIGYLSLLLKQDLIPDLIFKIETKQDIFNIDDTTRWDEDLKVNVVQKTIVTHLLDIKSMEDLCAIT